MESGVRTVLVVEDDRSMRLLFRVNLELEGYRVLEGATIPDARRLLDSEQIDFVVLDVHVGGDSGYDLIDAIRDRHRQAPIALITGSAEIGAEERARVDAVLPKPFALEDLIAAIGRLTGSAASS
ncbi:MAG TPA: response regulator [Gaiellaceae bacterium]